MKKLIIALALVVPFGIAHAEGTKGTSNTTGTGSGMNSDMGTMDEGSTDMNSQNRGTTTGAWDSNTTNRNARNTSLSSTQITEAQTALSDRGYEISSDGIVGPETKRAIKRFQAENGIPQSGTFDRATLNALNIEASDMDSDRVPASTPSTNSPTEY